MNAPACDDMHLLVQADLDGELDAASAAALAVHMQGCAGCAALQADLAAMSTRLRSGLTRHTASPGLRALILAQQPARPARRWPWRHGASFGAGMALAASIAAFIVLPSREGGIPEVVSAHIRALQPGHLVDVGSSDQHTVKPWFDGRLDFAPPVRDFTPQGFPLVGARLDYLGGRPVAALVYHRDKHVIDVFVWPDQRGGADGALQGYNVIAWEEDGMSFAAVSDLNAVELGMLVRLIRGVDRR